MPITNTRASSGSAGAATSLWDVTRSTLLAVHGRTNLPEAEPTKAFCSGALHLLPRSPSARQVSEAATVFQYRKAIPGGFDPEAAYTSVKEALTRPHPPSDPTFLQAAHDTVALLGPNWDATYLKHVESTVPNLSANLERIQPASLPHFSVDAFKAICTGDLPPVPIPTDRRLAIIPDGGKARCPTSGSILLLQLAPLAATLQDALERTGAVHRGKATPTTFRAFTEKPGEVCVSGDYRSATNYFESNNSVALVHELQRTSSRIPAALFDLLATSLQGGLTISKYGNFVRTNGQLMGDRPSFPLLCLTNLTGIVVGFGLTRAKALIKSRLLKINGDDIAFRCTETEYRTWRSRLPVCGLHIEDTKTLVHPKVVTLNSTFFMLRPRRLPREIWFFRASSCLAPLPPRARRTLHWHHRSRFASSILETVQSNLPRISTNKFRYHVLACRARNAVGLPASSASTIPPATSRTLPRQWRSLVNAARPLSGIYFPPHLPPPSPANPVATSTRPVVGYQTTDIKPVDGPSMSFHRQVTQYLGFHRRKLAPLPTLYVAPRRGLSKVLALRTWSPVTPMVSFPARQGLGWKKRDTYYCVDDGSPENTPLPSGPPVFLPATHGVPK
jgi:hypothetical protein